MSKKIITTTMVFILLSTSVLAAPKKDRWDYWFTVNDLNIDTIYHDEWNVLLQRYVVKKDGNYLVEYAKISLEDKFLLDNYIKFLAQIPITTYARKEQKAYWINLYNALTWQIILDYYPRLESIKEINISPGVFSQGPWDKRAVIIEGYPISLNDIEHRILRPIWSDDRVHYALNCGAKGCPDIQPQAFTSENMNSLLNDARTAFINNSRGVHVVKNTITISKIYKWFLHDFAFNTPELIEYFRTHAQGELRTQLDVLAGRKIKIKYHYDWKLNDASR